MVIMKGNFLRRKISYNLALRGFNFGGKDKHSRKPASNNQKDAEENPGRQPFSSFFDSRSSLFSKKPPKPETASPAEPLYPVENDWMVVK